MRVFICGQKLFGAEVYRLCRELGHDIAGVCAPGFRGTDSDIPFHLASGSGMPPDRLREAAELDGVPYIASGYLDASRLPDGIDVILSAHSHDFIGRKTRLKAKLGAIGYHPSLLPLHRGRDAVRWALKMGDRVTGGSIYWLNDNVDAGPVAARDWCFIRPGDTPETIWRRDLFPMGIQLFRDVLTDLANGVIVAERQDEKLATWEPSWDRQPIYRPDLPQLGSGPDGYTVVASSARGRRL